MRGEVCPRTTGRDAPPLDVPLRRRPTGHAPAARSPDEERDAAELRLETRRVYSRLERGLAGFGT